MVADLPVTSRWDEEGQPYIPYVLGFPLKTDEVFDIDHGHLRNGWPWSQPSSFVLKKPQRRGPGEERESVFGVRDG
jgi:hypothetical protein